MMGLYRLYHHGEEVANLPVDALAEDAPVYEKKQKNLLGWQRIQRIRAISASDH